jgi:hypothetical protein
MKIKTNSYETFWELVILVLHIRIALEKKVFGLSVTERRPSVAERTPSQQIWGGGEERERIRKVGFLQLPLRTSSRSKRLKMIA